MKYFLIGLLIGFMFGLFALGCLGHARDNIDETQSPDTHKPETITFSPEDCE